MPFFVVSQQNKGIRTQSQIQTMLTAAHLWNATAPRNPAQHHSPPQDVT
jgi:hypothetical protein